MGSSMAVQGDRGRGTYLTAAINTFPESQQDGNVACWRLRHLLLGHQESWCCLHALARACISGLQVLPYTYMCRMRKAWRCCCGSSCRRCLRTRMPYRGSAIPTCCPFRTVPHTLNGLAYPYHGAHPV